MMRVLVGHQEARKSGCWKFEGSAAGDLRAARCTAIIKYTVQPSNPRVHILHVAGAPRTIANPSTSIPPHEEGYAAHPHRARPGPPPGHGQHAGFPHVDRHLPR